MSTLPVGKENLEEIKIYFKDWVKRQPMSYLAMNGLLAPMRCLGSSNAISGL